MNLFDKPRHNTIIDSTIAGMPKIIVFTSNSEGHGFVFEPQSSPKPVDRNAVICIIFNRFKLLYHFLSMLSRSSSMRLSSSISFTICLYFSFDIFFARTVNSSSIIYSGK
jgi:hypothetical protein